jgi:hypothetical protein
MRSSRILCVVLVAIPAVILQDLLSKNALGMRALVPLKERPQRALKSFELPVRKQLAFAAIADERSSPSFSGSFRSKCNHA